ncbi:MAG: hypothetical protein NTW02_02775 [Cyanobium sp. LacPavin_0920_WC12_MAG_62_9]|nr:hypothetical protein [Cyanobium sp. LacPavin_0920_WC12_MAG_62_9]
MGRLFLTDDGRRLSLSADLRHRIGAGGQGRVFRAQLGCDFVAVKLLRHASQAKLVALQSLEPSCRAVATLPVHLLFDGAGSQVVGYAMRCIDPAKSISAARLFNFQEICQLEHYSWADAVLFAKRLAEAVASLHRLGVVIGDLNPENVFFERSGEASLGSWRAIVIDTDSFQLTDGHGSRHLCPVARPAYTAPELVGTDFSACWRQTSSDNFALAVLIYQLLLHDHQGQLRFQRRLIEPFNAALGLKKIFRFRVCDRPPGNGRSCLNSCTRNWCPAAEAAITTTPRIKTACGATSTNVLGSL